MSGPEQRREHPGAADGELEPGWRARGQRPREPQYPRAPDVADPRTRQVRVLSRRCAPCMFARPWFAPDDFAGLPAATLRRGGHLVCAATLPEIAPPGTKAGICRGFADGYARFSLALHLGRTLGSLVEIDPPGEEPGPAPPGAREPETAQHPDAGHGARAVEGPR